MNRERDATSLRISSPRRRSTTTSSRRFSLANSASELEVSLAHGDLRHHEVAKVSSGLSCDVESQGMLAMKKSKVSTKKQSKLQNEEDSWIVFATDADFQTKPKRLALSEKLGDELHQSRSSGCNRFSRSKRAAQRRSNSDDSLPSAQQTSSLSSGERNSIDSNARRLHKSFSAITMSPKKVNCGRSIGLATPSDGTASSRDKMLMRCYSSSSSLEDNLREPRRGRRHKIRTCRTNNPTDDGFNESLRLDYGGEDEAPKPTEFGVLDNSFETVATASFRWGFGSSGNLEISTHEDEFFEEVQVVGTKDTSKSLLYDLAKANEWNLVRQECLQRPWGAKHVGEEDGMTALHFAVMSRVNPYLRDEANANQRAPLELIKALVQACPESASVRCSEKKYTPLSYACLVADEGYLMEDAASIVRILLEAAPYCALVVTGENYSSLDIHIISYSKIHKQKKEVVSNCGRSSATVLRTLLELAPSLAQTRDYGKKVRGPIELLYRCNLKEFKAASSDDIRYNRQSNAGCTSRGSEISDWWAWKWTSMMLRSLSSQNNVSDLVEGEASFSVVHAATEMVGCPVPIICLATEAYPEHVKQRGETNGKFNCPLHEVCSWVTDSIQIDGDMTLARRKAKAISVLLETYPKATRMTNNHGETPLQLAVETNTPWNGGLGELVSAFPKALMLPRSLQDLPDDSPLANAMTYHDDDLGSVGFDEKEWAEESLLSVDGMYPFQIAAALSHVPRRRLQQQFNPQSSPDLKSQLEARDLSSLTSIFGLLRARPQALRQFIDEEKARETNKELARIKEAEDMSVATEETQEYHDEDF